MELEVNRSTLGQLVWLFKHLLPGIAELLTWGESELSVPIWSAQSIARLSLAQQSSLLEEIRLREQVPSQKELKGVVRAMRSGRSVADAWNESVESKPWLPAALTIILSCLIEGIFSDDDVALHGIPPKAAWDARIALLQARLVSSAQKEAPATVVATKKLQDTLRSSVTRMGPEATERLFGRFVQLFTVGWDEERYLKLRQAVDEAFRDRLKDMSEEERFAWLRGNIGRLGFGPKRTDRDGAPSRA